MKLLAAVIIILLAAILPSTALAHKPQIINSQTEITVESPEVSQAFYGRLAGQPAQFIINTTKPTELYVEITVPDRPSSRRDFKVTIENQQRQLQLPKKRWARFYEPFGGDNYLRGGSLKTKIEPGVTTITVSNGDNRGIYILVIGEQESFGPIEAIKAIGEIAIIRHDYFGHSWPSAIAARSLPLVIILLGPIFLIALFFWLRRR